MTKSSSFYVCLLTLCLFCSCNSQRQSESKTNTRAKNGQGGESHNHGHSHDETVSHTHGDGEGDSHSHYDYDPGDAEFAPATVVKATATSPEYIQLASEVEVIEDVSVAADSESSIRTHEGYFGPLLFGTDLRMFSLKLEPGMFLTEHTHPTESMVYTISGRWVLCSEGKRQVMKAGSAFHFGPDKPTGWETPFQEGALILITKRIAEGDDYESFCAKIRDMAEAVDKEMAGGVPFYFHQLKPEHPAIAFAKAHNPAFDELLEQLKRN